MTMQTVISIEQREEMLLAEILCARMDEKCTQEVQDAISAAASESCHLPVVLLLSKVEFVPSLSLGALVNLLLELKKRDQRLMLVSLRPTVRDALSVTRLDELFEIYENLDDAVAQVRASS